MRVTSRTASAVPCALILITIFSASVFSASVAPGEDRIELVPQEVSGRAQAVNLKMDVLGVLRLNPNGGEVKRVPMRVSGRFEYQERFLTDEGTVQAVRSYDRATADFQIGEGKSNLEFPKNSGLIVVDYEPVSKTEEGDYRIVFNRVDKMITRDEIDLINVPFNTSIVNRLLPETGSTSVNQTWQPSNEVLAALLNIDAISSNDINLKLHSASENFATILISGKVNGAVSGVATEVDLNGVIKFDRSEKRVRSVNVTIQENRSIGHAEPGFNVTAKLNADLAFTGIPKELTDKAMADAGFKRSGEAQFIKYESDVTYFTFVYDPRWRIMVDQPKLTVMRLVDKGDLIAQCNISPLTAYEPGKRLELTKFTEEVSAAIKEGNGKVVESREFETANGLNIIRVDASGLVKELPITWVYYHIADKKGRRAAMVCTLESRLYDRLAESDQVIARSFEFLEQPEPQRALPQHASPQSTDAAAAKAESAKADSTATSVK